MDEQRFQAYVALIEQLLGCPQGQEGQILQANAELVDARLLEVMEQYAAYLESQSDSNMRWLREFAAQLAQTLGMTAIPEAEVGAAVRSVLGGEQFLLETLRLVSESNGDPKQVYPVWAQQQVQFNAALLKSLPSETAQLLAQNLEQQADIAAVLVDFGNLINQFPLGERRLNIELGIAAYKQALTVMTQTAMPVEWATTMSNLAAAYDKRIQGDRADNIEQAINLYQQALTVRTQDAVPIKWALTMHNLAAAYYSRIRGNRVENIEQAIAAYRQSLAVITHSEMPIEWAQTMMNLATAYYSRIWGDRVENIDQAITAYKQALTVRTQMTMPVEWAQTMSNLATVYRNRIRGDRAENIEQAITTYKQALTLRTQTAMPVEWATTMMNLATAYAERIRGVRAENIEQAIAAYEQALTVMTQATMPVEWAITMMNLAISYSFRVRGDRAENIEQAIAAYEQALTVMTQTTVPVEWATTMNNLAAAYRERIRGVRAENIEQAIAACEQALTVRTLSIMPAEWATTMGNLADAYGKRIQGDRADNIEQAIVAYKGSLEVFTPELLPNDCRRVARNLANLYNDQQRWQEAIPIYQKALQAAETLYQSAGLLDSKVAELSETADLPRRAAYALARCGELQAAVLTLEQGCARSLSETLERDRANLDQLQQRNADLYNQYRMLTERLRNLENQQRNRATSSDRHSLTPEALRDSASALRQQLDTLIQEIRQVPGYEKFLTLPTFEDVCRAVKSERPLVYLVPTPANSLALIVAPEGIQSLWLDALPEERLGEILQAWFAAYDQSQRDRQGWFTTIDSVTRKLWEPLMAPLIRQLKIYNFYQAILIPTGYLSLLPLHAAWTEDSTMPNGQHYALDDIHFTYAPNAKSLTAAGAIATCVQADSILAIDNPRQDLPNSEREINAAIAHFPQSTVLRHSEATVEVVQSQLSEAAIAHFSCHGTANLNEPLNSGLLMSDGLLTLKDIFALNLTDNGGIRLAILSACETGLQGIENADEAISLPTGLLQAGVAAVIASLWSISDLSTMLLLSRFYDFWCTDHLEPSKALRQAQLWVRDTTSQQKAKHFQATNPDLFRALILLPPDYFAHPFHWAAFSYVGV